MGLFIKVRRVVSFFTPSVTHCTVPCFFTVDSTLQAVHWTAQKTPLSYNEIKLSPSCGFSGLHAKKKNQPVFSMHMCVLKMGVNPHLPQSPDYTGMSSICLQTCLTLRRSNMGLDSSLDLPPVYVHFYFIPPCCLWKHHSLTELSSTSCFPSLLYTPPSPVFHSSPSPPLPLPPLI